eukprot:gene13735-29210_t
MGGKFGRYFNLRNRLNCYQGVGRYQDAHYLIHERLVMYGGRKLQPVIDMLKPINDWAKGIGKLCIIFLHSDCEGPITDQLSSLIVFRLGINRSDYHVNEHMWPFIPHEKGLETFGKNKGVTRPIVGFCGALSHPTRTELIHAISNDSRFQSNFIIRDKFWGGYAHGNQTITDFIENIRTSHFVICSRGNGNWSMRLYQVLQLGRICIFIDTNTTLIFENDINWNKLVIIGKNAQEVLEKVLHWWNHVDIEEVQRASQWIHEQYLTDKGFFQRLWHIIKFQDDIKDYNAKPRLKN